MRWNLGVLIGGIVAGTTFAAGAACGGDDDDGTCTPNCAGRVCGTDGCTGQCPPGCPVGQSCTAAGTCQSTTTNPTNEEGCLQLLTALCQRGIACVDYYCIATGERIVDVGGCFACMGAVDRCAATPNADTPMTDGDVAEMNRCISDIGVAACADITGGVLPASCS
jgi:hypothetical protein